MELFIIFVLVISCGFYFQYKKTIHNFFSATPTKAFLLPNESISDAWEAIKTFVVENKLKITAEFYLDINNRKKSSVPFSELVFPALNQDDNNFSALELSYDNFLSQTYKGKMIASFQQGQDIEEVAKIYQGPKHFNMTFYGRSQSVDVVEQVVDIIAAFRKQKHDMVANLRLYVEAPRELFSKIQSSTNIKCSCCILQ